jgi:hypothetical protein
MTNKLPMTILVGATLAVLLAGCASPGPSPGVQRKEALLTQCGFKMFPANTPQQLQQLQTLPADRISVVNRSGKRYYVYPDPAQKVLYVGHDAQYQAYANQRENVQEIKAYDQFSKGDPALAKYEHQAEVLSGLEYSTGWDQGWGSWDDQ